MNNNTSVNIDLLIDRLHRYWLEVQETYASTPREMTDTRIREIRKKYGVRQSSFTYGVSLDKPVPLEITCNILVRRTKKRVMVGPFKFHKRRVEICFSCDGETDEKLNAYMQRTGMHCDVDVAQINRKTLPGKIADMDGHIGVVRGMAIVSESEGNGQCRVNISFTDLPEITPRRPY